MLRRSARAVRSAHAAAAPASTLLWFTLAAMLVARVAAAETSPADSVALSWLPDRAAPGETIELAVEGPEVLTLHAWLPGLDAAPTRLRYDAETGLHLGALRLPDDAPTRGWCTVRVQTADDREWNFRLALAPPDPA